MPITGHSPLHSFKPCLLNLSTKYQKVNQFHLPIINISLINLIVLGCHPANWSYQTRPNHSILINYNVASLSTTMVYNLGYKFSEANGQASRKICTLLPSPRAPPTYLTCLVNLSQPFLIMLQRLHP